MIRIYEKYNKNTKCIVEITTQKNEKYLSERRNPLARLPAYLVSTKKLPRVGLLKNV